MPSLTFPSYCLASSFGNTHPDEGTSQSTCGGPDTRAGKRRHNRPGRDKRSEPWDRQCPDPNHPAQRSAEHRTAASAGGCAFGGLGMLLVRKIARSRLVRKKNRNIVLGKSRALQLIGNIELP